MANEITLCGLNDVGGVNPNGVYTIASQVNGKDSWERTVNSVTFRVQFLPFTGNPILDEWQLIDVANSGAFLAITGTRPVLSTPWENDWIDNGYGVAAVTEGNAGCSTICDPANDMFDTPTEDGCDRVKRLWSLGYV
jgi:hypothetical protein